MLIRTLLSLLIISHALAEFSNVLYCNKKMTGDYRFRMIRLAQKFDNNDEIHFSVKLRGNNPNMSYFNLYNGFGNLFHSGPIQLHFRAQHRRGNIIYNTFNVKKGKWGKEEFTKNPFRKDQVYMIKVVKFPNVFKVYVNGALLKTYHLRIDKLKPIGNFMGYGDWDVLSLEMKCANYKATSGSDGSSGSGTADASDNNSKILAKAGNSGKLENSGNLEGKDGEKDLGMKNTDGSSSRATESVIGKGGDGQNESASGSDSSVKNGATHVVIQKNVYHQNIVINNGHKPEKNGPSVYNPDDEC